MTLKHLTVIPVPGIGTEDVVVATSGPEAGSVFTGTEDGVIWRVSPDGAWSRVRDGLPAVQALL